MREALSLYVYIYMSGVFFHVFPPRRPQLDSNTPSGATPHPRPPRLHSQVPVLAGNHSYIECSITVMMPVPTGCGTARRGRGAGPP